MISRQDKRAAEGEGRAEPSDPATRASADSEEEPTLKQEALEEDEEELEIEPEQHELEVSEDELAAGQGTREVELHSGDGEEEGSAAQVPGALAPRSLPLARYDALQAYINQAKRYALLTPDEEHELAVRYVEEGDLEAARRLVTSNLRLVVKIAHEYRKAYRNLLDLVQEGNIGLMHAVKKFDPYRGVRLSSYAAWWIRAYILKFILNNWRMVKIGTTQAQRKLFFNLRKEMERLEAMGVESPGPKLLAERLDVSEEEVRSMQRRLAAGDLSLDAPMRADDSDSASRLDFVTDRATAPDRAVENQEFSALLQEKLQGFRGQLAGREREIFDLRTLSEEPLTLQEIGDRYGITRERARQIERRMLDRLRDFLRQELGEAVDVALEQLDEA